MRVYASPWHACARAWMHLSVHACVLVPKLLPGSALVRVHVEWPALTAHRQVAHTQAGGGARQHTGAPQGRLAHRGAVTDRELLVHTWFMDWW